MATAKQASAKKQASKAVAQTPAAKTPAAKTPAAKKLVAKTPAAKTPAAKTPAAKKLVAGKQATAAPTPSKPTKDAMPVAKTKTPPKIKTKSAVTLSSPAPASDAKQPASVAPTAAPKKAVTKPERMGFVVKGVTKDGISYTKDFDAKFLQAQKALLLTERVALTGQADRLEDEANSLIEEGEMGDVQFDDEGGEGDTMVVERERDLALSAQARQMVADIDTAIERLATGAYGYSIESGRPIPRERLEAIPWATVLVEEKVGGIGRR